MPREDDLSNRFDYLFEPLPPDESTGDAADTEPAPTTPSDDDPASPSKAPVRLAFAAFILGVVAAVSVVAALLLQRPDDATDSIDVSPDPAPLSTTAPGLPSRAAPPPPAPPPTETSEAGHPPNAQLVTQPEPQQPTAARRKPAAGVPSTPKTRAPISVAPTKRAPFPDQRPGDTEETDAGGGLLGGLPGPDLPGPL